ncbi:MAG: polyprenol monophosphomannose synthase [Candidatus Spechtbacterales bacterium]|nr:polyprenol monophosphomannose synthase [Candidatus Spechtbacterales bacterium]
MDKHLVIIPTYNEIDNIKELVPEILELPHDFHILVVDDNSPDGTGELVEDMSLKHERINVLRRPWKEGLGKAYIAGFKWALDKDYDTILQMDADFSHLPDYLPRFIKKLNKHDLVIGSRCYNGRLSVVNWDIKRVLLSRLGTTYARLVTGVPMTDATAGFKGWRREVLEAIDLDKVLSEGYSFQIEMNWRAKQAGANIGEMPIIFFDRRHGESKMNASIVKEALWILWKIKIKK